MPQKCWHFSHARNEEITKCDNAGVTKNVAKMWDDYAKSIGTTAANLTKQQKIQAEVTGILQESVYQTGDAAKVAGTYSGQIMQLGFNFNNLKIAIGNALIPIAQAVLPGINAMINGLTRLANVFSQVTALIFGRQAKAQAQVAGTAASGAKAENDLAKATTKAGKATEKAGKQAESALAGFDELNVLAKDAAGGMDSVAAGMEDASFGGAGVGDNYGGEIGGDITISPAVQAAVDTMMRLLEPLKNINLDNLKMAFDNLRVSLEPITKAIFEGLEWAYLNIFVPLAEWTIEDLLPVFLDILSSALSILASVIKALQPLGKWLWENFLNPLAAWTGGVIIDTLKWLAQRLQDLSAWVSENKSLIQDIVIVIGSFAAAWLLVTGAMNAWNIAVSIWNAIGVIATGITTAFGAAVAFLTSPITLVILAIGALIAIVILLIKHWDDVKRAAKLVWDSIVGIWGKASAWFTNNVLNPIKTEFKKAINFLIGLAEGFTNGFLSGINAIIGAFNRISFSIPDWVPVIGGKSFEFNIPRVNPISIPRLATGAVIPPNAEFMAILGDQKNGRNLEAPEGLIRQIIQEELSNLPAPSVTVVAEGNEAGLIRYLNFKVKQEEQRVGKNMIKGAPAW